MRFVLFDLDDTLYPKETGLTAAINRRIISYMVERMGLAPGIVEVMRKEYFEKYGTTMRGLSIHYGIDRDEYLSYVHDVPVEEFLRPNPALDAALSRLPLEKAIFTNASAAHSRRVLAALGIAHHFKRIFDVASFGYESKPAPAAYRRVLEMLAARPEECLLVEDSTRNLVPAKALGMITILVDNARASYLEGIDYVIADVTELPCVYERLVRIHA